MRTLLVWFLEALVKLYFPRRVVVGREKITGLSSGPLLFVLNHPNALFDPIVLRIALGLHIRFLGKSTLWGNPIGAYTMNAFGGIPVYRKQDVAVGGGDTALNEKTFVLCREALARGEYLALFPEGVSHADASLKPLKTGAARIALSSEAEQHWSLGLRIVPCGLDYEDRAIFRSGVVLEVGEPMSVAAYHHAYLADERSTVETLTDELRTALDEVVVQAPTRELLDGVSFIAAWTAETSSTAEDPALRRERSKELLDAYRQMHAHNPAEAETLVRSARDYADTLRRLGIADPWSLEVGRVSFSQVLFAATKLLLLLPFAVVGFVLGWIPYRLAGEAAKAYAKGYEDMLGTVKLLAGMLFLTTAWVVEAIIVTYHKGVLWGACVFLLGPTMGYLALRWDETFSTAWLALQHLYWRQQRPGVAARLIQKRRALALRITEALERFRTTSTTTEARTESKSDE